MAKINFELFSRNFEISSEIETEEYLKNLIQLFKEKIEKLENLTKMEDKIKLLVYFAINLLDENIKIKELSLEYNLNLINIENMIKKLERIANDSTNSE
ncbi:MAG: cell division protein ZapA [Spirochaetes bacterium]|nr:cell division protein ZapA [Spirochaetota bacterium]